MAIDLASLQSRDGARRVFAGPGSQSIKQSRSAVMCSASRMKGELHPTKIVRPEPYLFILHLDESLQLVALFSGIATSRDIHGLHAALWVSHHLNTT